MGTLAGFSHHSLPLPVNETDDGSPELVAGGNGPRAKVMARGMGSGGGSRASASRGMGAGGGSRSSACAGWRDAQKAWLAGRIGPPREVEVKGLWARRSSGPLPDVNEAWDQRELDEKWRLAGLASQHGSAYAELFSDSEQRPQWVLDMRARGEEVAARSSGVGGGKKEGVSEEGVGVSEEKEVPARFLLAARAACGDLEEEELRSVASAMWARERARGKA